MEAEVYEVLEPRRRDSEIKLVKVIGLDARLFGAAKREARTKLEDEWKVRSVAASDRDGLPVAVVYVERKLKPVKERKRTKPVTHTGIVGKGRSLIDKIRGTKRARRAKRGR